MKTKRSSLTVAGLFLSTALAAFAGPSPTYETLNRPQQFQQLKQGDHIVYVYHQCKIVTSQGVPSPAQAMEYCQEGGTVTCPACKMKFKIVAKGSPKTPADQREVSCVNAQGEECLFIAKAPDHN